MGAAWSGLENWDAAERAWLRALELDPKNYAALNNLGKMYLDTRRQTNHDVVKESATLVWYAALD